MRLARRLSRISSYLHSQIRLSTASEVESTPFAYASRQESSFRIENNNCTAASAATNNETDKVLLDTSTSIVFVALLVFAGLVFLYQRRTRINRIQVRQIRPIAAATTTTTSTSADTDSQPVTHPTPSSTSREPNFLKDILRFRDPYHSASKKSS